MKILLVHNYYKQRGGEDVSFDSEVQMLQHFGHEVQTYTRRNHEIDNLTKAQVAVQSVFSRHTKREVERILQRFRADVIHCTNLFL